MSTPVDLPAFVAAHAAGQKNQALARQFGLSVSTVKRLKQKLGLGNNDPRNTLGRLGERLLEQALKAQGFAVTIMAEGHAFDLLVEGQRLEVKTSATLKGNSCRFRLNERRSSNHAAYRYDKAYQRDADVLALVVIEEGALKQLYLLPVALWQPSIKVLPESPFCPYALYRNVTHLLQRPLAA
ncbi:hypothetical protein [Deinococcus arcticus]|uniref:hypothetical protein n=1 Tax=Deinococcus arcticus TaxID=2136176 RepID=UPI0011B229D2|nr:hypothetical protein [Deinococcus arcticus]